MLRIAKNLPLFLLITCASNGYGQVGAVTPGKSTDTVAPNFTAAAVDIPSRPGKGSTFTIVLPSAELS